MKANFNIAKNVRNSRSISALSALRKLQSLGLLLCALLFGSMQMWGAVVSGTAYAVTTPVATGWTATSTDADYAKLTSGNYVLSDVFCQNGITSVAAKIRKFGGPSAAQRLITIEWIDEKTGDATVLGTITRDNTSLAYVTLSSLSNTPTANTEGRIKLSCKGANSSKCSCVSEVKITYTSGSCTTPSHNIYYDTPFSHGSITGASSADEGASVSLTVAPDDGYYLSSLSVQTYNNSDVYIADVEVGDGYTFTMPSDFTGYVWVTGSFSALPSYTITYSVPSCVTALGTLTSQTYFRAPADGVPGYRFEGWVTSAISTSTSTKPTTIYKPGDVIPTNNTTFYALYSAVSDGWSLMTSAPTSGKLYMLTSSSDASNSNASKNEAASQGRIAYETVNTTDNVITNTNWSLIWTFIKDGDYWYVYNEIVRKYLAAVDANATSSSDRKCTLSETKNDNAAWTLSVSAAGQITLTNKARSSATDKIYKINTGYGGFYSTGTQPYFFEQNSVSASYTTNPTCPVTTFSVTYNKNTSETVTNMPTDNNDYDDGDDVSIPNTTPSRTGYTFANWYTNEGCTTPSGGYAVNTSNAFQIHENTTLYAKWTPNPYNLAVLSVGHATIKATPAGGSDITEGNNANVDCGKTVTLNYSSVGDNYTFTNWVILKASDDSDVSGSVSLSSATANNATFVMPAYAVKISAVITAPWIYFTSCSNKLKVYYNANTSDVSVANMPTDNTEYDENDDVSIPNTTPTRTGYTFYRWYTNEGCTTPAAGYAVNTSNAFQITANTTLYAKWNVNEYRIDVATPDRVTIKATPSGGSDITEGNHANAEFGQTVTLNYTSLEDGYGLTWDVYKTGDPSTKVSLSSTTANNATFTMPAYPVTVTATTAVRPSTTVTFYLGTSNTASGTLSIGSNTIKFYNDEAGITALPTVSSISCGDWNTVVGWTENGSYSSSTTPPTMISASVGTPYKPATDKTVYAVYKKVDGSDDFDGTNDGTYYVKGTSSSTAYYAAACLGSLSSTIDNTSSTTAGATEFTFTKNGDYYNISCSEGTYVQTSGTTTTANSDGALWTATEVGSLGASGSGYWEFVNKGTNTKAIAFDAQYSQLKFNFNSAKSNLEDGSNTRYVPIELVSASTNYYSVNPECTSITVSKGTCTPASSVLDASSHACDFKLNNTNNSSVTTSSGGSVTIYLYPNDDYTDVGATVSVDVPGNVTTINAINTETHTCMISGITGDITVSVSYVERPKYTVTLYDNGTKRGELTEEHFGAGVPLPSGNNCGGGSPFTFVGWTESAVELNADPVRPASATLHTAGTYVPGENKTLYSVYSRSVNGCEDFASGVSGAYKIYYDGSKYALSSGGSTTYYAGGTSGDAEVFYFAYAPAHSAYTIRTSAGYLGWGGSSGSETISKGNASPYYWKISGSSSNWVITPEPSSITRQFKSSDGSRFQMYAAGTSGKAILQKSAMTYYYNTAICTDAQITFHDGGGSISGTPTTPTGASWNSSTHVLSGLEDCDKITTFPTASYDGWTFIGWSTEDYSNSGKHVADHAEENASTDEPDGSGIYKTDGNPYVVRGGSVDLYPVFTRFPENEPFNTETGGDYYIYYLKPGTDDGYGANIRVYAGEYVDEKRYDQTTSCAAATTFTFTKDGDIWHIYDKTTSKYVAGLSGEDWLLHANDLSGTLDDWTITIKSGNQFYASCQGGGRYISFSTSANYFMDYSTTANSGICLPVYLGSCTERIYSSEPNPTPVIDLDGEPYVTSSNGERVRATATMTLSAAHLNTLPANKVIVSGGTGLKFATTASANPTPTVSLSLTEGSLAATTIYVYYTPSATEDGLENIIVTAKAYNGSSYKEFQKTGTVHARHLPADFVIAAKWNDKWYAMPNTCTSSGSSTTGVLITVDNDNDPTCATYAPMTAKWGMRQTKDGSRTDGSYNDRLVFTERGTTATANSQQALYNYNSADIYTNATYANYNNTNPDRYEWIPVTSDFKDYTLTNANDAGRTLILRNSDGEFKAQNTDQAYDGKVRLLPATFKEDNVQILEWKASSVVIMYTGTETTAKTKVGSNAQSSAQTLSGKKIAHGIYELSAPSLTGNAGKNLEISFGSDVSKKLFEIPIIITGNSTAATGHDKQDVVIVKNAKLTAATTKYSYRNIYVYGGGKLNIPTGTALGVNNIILRAGSISTDGAGGSATYEYIYPQVYLAGTFSSTKTDIKYEYITDYTHWYQLCLPFNASLNSIHYPKEYYGNIVTEGNSGSWVIKRYAGEIRATGEYDAWKDIEKDSPKKTEVTAGNGYLFWGAPKNVTIGGDKQRQTWGIQRMTMSVTAAAATSAETANKNISVDSYSDVEGKSTKPNDQGWNLVGNPYMVNLTDLSSTSMIAGELVKDSVDGKWTGKWKNNGDGVRYVTIPDYHFDNYVAKTASVAAGAGDFMPGRAFFVQIAKGATTLTFAATNRASLMPALFAKTEQPIDIETGIVLSDESKHDEVNFWIKDGKTEAYEYNADYPKTMNTTNFNIYGVHSNGELSWVAISPEIAEGSMAIGYQVPAAGDYMLSLSETYVSDEIEHVFVTDHGVSPEVTTDLMEEDYNFYVNQAETNDVRFTVAFKLKVEDPGTTTNVENTAGVDSDKPLKFIYNDKMYILRNGIIYDAVGKKVSEINK